ncbi:MAG: SHOCT domain-containing protein [Planctomycetota bacterium]|jgi:hypothetical protein
MAIWRSVTGPATTRAEGLFSDVLPVLLGLLGVVAVGATVVWLARRFLRRDAAAPPEGFTLQDLRDLHRAGELSDEEFERARAAMIARVKGPPPDAPADDPAGEQDR